MGDHQKPRKFSTTSLTFLSLFCFTALLLGFSLFKSSSPPPLKPPLELKPTPLCDLTDGHWVFDPTAASSARYDHTCKEIFKGWNCILNNKPNAKDVMNWQWKPRNCHLSDFDPASFLERFRDTSIGFVGDSLNRNMFVSLFCMLRRVSSDVKKWHPAKADRGFTFLKYNLTIAYHRTKFEALCVHVLS